MPRRVPKPAARPAARPMARKPPAVSARPAQPNILVIWGDDIGQSNLSCYTHGLMGYQTPNIDPPR
jgi:arylsulfatase A-like enzyme